MSNVFPQTWITSITPKQNSISVDRNAKITITFDRELSQSTPIESTIVVIGRIFGKYHPESITYSQSSKTISYVSAKPFAFGEKIQVSVTPNVKDVNGTQLPRSYVFDFMIGSNKNSGSFKNTFAVENGIAFVGNLTLGDFDGNNTIDVMAGEIGAGHALNVFYGTGQGTFQNFNRMPVNIYPQWTTNVDLDNDGDLDAVIASLTLNTFMNDGNGKYAFDTSYSLRSPSSHVQVGDLNGDGLNDLFYTNGFDSGGTTLINNGKGRFPIQYMTEKRTFTGTGSGIADFDNNGTLDVAIAGYNDSGAEETRVSIFSNDGTGKMTLVSEIKSGGLFYFVEPGDLDGDGDADYIAMDSKTGNSKIYLNNGSAFFTYYASLAAYDVINDIHLQDLDGDGDLDLIASDQTTNPGSFSIWKNDGKANFTQERVKSSAGGISFKTADIDNDGDIDIVATTYCFCGPFLEVFKNISPTIVENKQYAKIPITPELFQNYPNPFNGITTVQYEIATLSKVIIKVYDLLGREVNILVNQEQKAGQYSIRWDANVSSGLYFCKLESQSIENPAKIFVATRKMQLIQ